jgi:hypothetical protein
MVNFSVNFIKTASDDGYWELYADGTMVGTFSVLEIAGLYANDPVAMKLISNSKFGDIIIGAASGLQGSKEISLKILPFLKRVLQTQIEESLEG